jgi:hypothetical protein
MMMLCKTWSAFNVEKSDNPFSFYTQCITNSFFQFDNQERKQRNIRDLLLVDQGLTPSYNFQNENSSDTHFVEDEQDFYFNEHTSEKLTAYLTTDDVEVSNSTPQYYENSTGI